MRVAIDGTALVVGGAVTWLRELVPVLCAASPNDQFWVFLRSDVRGILREIPANCQIMSVGLPQKIRIIWRLAWQEFVLPLWLRKIKADVLIAPNEITPLLVPCRVVVGIQNANPYWGPSASTWLGRRREWFLRSLTRISAFRADKVFFVSEWSRQVISRELGLPLQKSRVIHHGVSKRFHPKEENTVEQDKEASRYVIAVGSVRSHKDYITLLKAWKYIVANYNQYLDLLIIGPILESGYYQRLISLLDQFRTDCRVSFFHAACQDDMIRLYQGAAVLVMPSYVETFGFPMVEAMACGIPVVASDIPVTHEICGEAACYYRLGDPIDLAEKLVDVLRDWDIRAQMIKVGVERASHFSWDRTAIQILELLKIN